MASHGTPFRPGNKAGKPGQFKPGQSGNPRGLTKGLREVREAARCYTEEMLQILVKIARDEKASTAARASAAMYVIDRGHGKAPQYIELQHSTELGDMSDAELIAIIAAGGADGTEPKSNGGTDPAGSPGDPAQPH
jgi:Family of unknown function (DUF5681)